MCHFVVVRRMQDLLMILMQSYPPPPQPYDSSAAVWLEQSQPLQAATHAGLVRILPRFIPTACPKQVNHSACSELHRVLNRDLPSAIAMRGSLFDPRSICKRGRLISKL